MTTETLTQPIKKQETKLNPWHYVSEEEWNDWKWQLANRLNSIEDFSHLFQLTQEEKEGLSESGHFRVDVTPYFAMQINPDDPYDPLRRQVMPLARELVPFDSSMVDSLGEEAHSPVPGLVHRYPDRVLMMVTSQCASYCRFCTRSRIVGDPHENFSSQDFERQIDYIKNNPSIRDVLLSGGDPLILSDKIIDRLLDEITSIPHVEVVRINTRVPVFLPQRVTSELINIFKKYQPLWVNININHSQELTSELSDSLANMADAGIPLGSQTVLMAGINDCPNIMLDLVQKLVANRVRPYYLYQCDLVSGAGHFRTPVAKGIEIMEALYGHTSGYAIPTYVIDSPGGGGKVPVLPNYLISMSDTRVAVRNYEGVISSYRQPDAYRPHDSSTCTSCNIRKSSGPDQKGVYGLLSGEKNMIKPENWDHVHAREN